MNTSLDRYDSIEKLIFDEGLRIESLDFNPELNIMFIYLNNGHLIKTSLSLFQSLATASNEALKNFRLIANGTGFIGPNWMKTLA